jgi:hypothetical protein
VQGWRRAHPGEVAWRLDGGLLGASPWWLDQIDPGTDRWRGQDDPEPDRSRSRDKDQTKRMGTTGELDHGGREGQRRPEREPVMETRAI